MVYVGTFTEKDLNDGKDKITIQQKKQETGLKYTNTTLIKKSGKIVGMKVWVCSADEFVI